MKAEKKRRGRSKGNRREEILEVAAELFARGGFEATSIRAIGDAAGILSGSLYHHFESKEQMLHDLLRPFVSGLVPMYEEVIASGGTVSELLKKLFAAGLRVSVENSYELMIIMHERKFLNRSSEFAYVGETMQEVERIWFAVLQEGVRSNVFNKQLDMNLVLRLIMDIFSSTASWFGPNSRYTMDQVLDNQVNLLLIGILNH